MKGNFKDTPFDEVLTQIEKQKRSGILIVTHKSCNITIQLKKGMIISVRSSGMKRFLGAMLVQSSYITRDELGKALIVQQKRYRKLGSILLEKGKLPKWKLEKFIEFQSWDLLLSLFFLDDSTFEFIKSGVDGEPENYVEINVDQLVQIGRELMDERVNIKALLPHNQLVFRKTNNFENQMEKIGNALSDDEKVIINQLDGRRSVKNLAYTTLLGEYRTRKAIYSLVESGLIKKSKFLFFFDYKKKTGVEDEDIIHVDIEKLPIILFNFVVVLALFFTFYYHNPDPFDLMGWFVNKKQNIQDVKEFLSEYQKEKIKFGLYVHYLSEGKFPDTLEQLTQGKYRVLKEIDLKYPWEASYFYQKKELGYVLLAPKN